MTISEWVTENYEDLRKTLLNITRQDIDLVDDLLHEVIIIFMEHKKAQELIDNGQAKWFFIRISLNQYRSTSSHFYRNYKRKNLKLEEEWLIPADEDYDIDEDIIIEKMLNSIEDMLKSNIPTEKHYALIMMVYFSNGHNFAECARILNVPRTTIRRQFFEGVKIVWKKISKQDINAHYNDLPIKILSSKLLKHYGRKRY
jgi:DNA-directed RNA polymerase specialized sigma24 family protein